MIYAALVRIQIYKYIALIRPTSPVRRNGLIDDAIKLLEDNKNLTSIRAMRKVSEHPFRIWKEIESKENLVPIIEDIFEPGNVPRQLHSDNYFYQSGEIELVRRSTLQLGSISGVKVGALLMDQKNPDIDTLDDI